MLVLEAMKMENEMRAPRPGVVRQLNVRAGQSVNLNEVMVEIHAPAFEQGTGYAYEKLKRKTGDWATAGCAVVLRKTGNTVSHVRIALTNVAPTALRAEAAEAALLGQAFTPAAVQAAADAATAICEPAEDLRGDAEYKTAMAGEMVKRALAKAWARCA